MATATLTDSVHRHNGPSIRFLSLPSVMAKTGFKKSYLYQAVREGTFPPIVKIGRSSRFIASEVAAVLRAWTLQMGKEEIRQLIAAMVAAR